MANPAGQHAVNVVIAAAPVASFWAHFPEVVTVIVGCLAATYYTLTIIEKLAGWRAQWLQIHQSGTSVALKHEAEKPKE